MIIAVAARSPSSHRIRVVFQLQLGAAQETVAVEAAATHVQTDSGEISNLITDQQLSQTSMSGHSFSWRSCSAPTQAARLISRSSAPMLSTELSEARCGIARVRSQIGRKIPPFMCRNTVSGRGKANRFNGT